MGKINSVAVIFFVTCTVFSAGSAQDFSEWLDPLLHPGYADWIEETGSRYEKSPIPLILTSVNVTKNGVRIGSINVLFNYTFTHVLPSNTHTIPEETSLDGRSVGIMTYYQSIQISGGYEIDGYVECKNETTQNVTGRGPFIRGAVGVFLTLVHVRYDGFDITQDGHIDLSAARQTKSFSATSLPPPWGDDIFVMDFLNAAGCEEEVKMAIRRAVEKEVFNFSEYTIHPVPAYSKLHEFLEKVLAENPISESK